MKNISVFVSAVQQNAPENSSPCGWKTLERFLFWDMQVQTPFFWMDINFSK